MVVMALIDWVLPPTKGIRRLAEFYVGPYSGVLMDYDGTLRLQLSMPFEDASAELSADGIRVWHDTIGIMEQMWRSGCDPQVIAELTPSVPLAVRLQLGRVSEPGVLDPVWLRPNDVLVCATYGGLALHICRSRRPPHPLGLALNDRRIRYVRRVQRSEVADRVCSEMRRVTATAVRVLSDQAP
jgi:hypothetical protein